MHAWVLCGLELWYIHLPPRFCLKSCVCVCICVCVYICICYCGGQIGLHICAQKGRTEVNPGRYFSGTIHLVLWDKFSSWLTAYALDNFGWSMSPRTQFHFLITWIRHMCDHEQYVISWVLKNSCIYVILFNMKWKNTPLILSIL